MSLTPTTFAQLVGAGVPKAFLSRVETRARETGGLYASTYGTSSGDQIRVFFDPVGSAARPAGWYARGITFAAAASTTAALQTVGPGGGTAEMSLTSTTRPMGTAQFSFLGDIGRVLGGAAGGLIKGGPLGAIGGAIGALAGGGSKPTKMDVYGIQAGPGGGPVGPVSFPQRPPPPSTTTSRIDLNPFIPGSIYESTTTTGGGMPVSGGCPAGYHPNKTSYHLKDGTFVAKGTRCVRNRRRNAMNPRALSRALARVDSAKRWQSKLSGVTTRKYTSSGALKKC